MSKYYLGYQGYITEQSPYHLKLMTYIRNTFSFLFLQYLPKVLTSNISRKFKNHRAFNKR